MSDVADDYLTRLDLLCEAASPGPWTAEGDAAVYPPIGAQVCDVCEIPGTDDERRDGEAVANGLLIAESRTALPLLIAEIRRLRAEPRLTVTRTNWQPNPIIDDTNQLSAAESIRIISDPK